jgi:hypothetical protein
LIIDLDDVDRLVIDGADDLRFEKLVQGFAVKCCQRDFFCDSPFSSFDQSLVGQVVFNVSPVRECSKNEEEPMAIKISNGTAKNTPTNT